MKKNLIYFLVFFYSILYGAEFNLQAYKTTIIKMENGQALIPNDANIQIGSSGIVVHKINPYDETIVARAVVDKIDGSFANIRFEAFISLKQNAFPLPKLLPQVGDEVILNFLYDRSLIVVPNREIYENIVKAFPTINFVHPDIVAAYLNINYKPNPTRDDFRHMCNQTASGLIFFAFDGEAYFVDCQSFEALKKYQSGEVASYVLPFYSRVKDPQFPFFSLGISKMKDFDKYYKKLINFKIIEEQR